MVFNNAFNTNYFTSWTAECFVRKTCYIEVNALNYITNYVANVVFIDRGDGNYNTNILIE